MSRSERFVGGVSLGYIGQFVILVASFVLTPFYLSSVGKPLFGLWIVAQQLLAYVQLTDLGLSGIVAREMAYATGRERASLTGQTVPKILAIAARISLAQTPLFLGAAFLLLTLLPSDWNALARPLGWALSGYGVLFPFRIAPVCLQGLQDLSFAAALSLTAWIGATVLTVAWVVIDPGLTGFLAGWLALHAIQTVGGLARLILKYPHAMGFLRESVTFSEMLAQMKKSLWVSASQLSQLFLNSTDATIVGRSISGSAAVTFSLTSRLTTTLGNNPRLLLETARPGLSEVTMEGDRERTLHVSNLLSTLMVWMSGGIFSVVLFVNEGFIGWWVGSDNFAGQLITFLVLANMLVRHWHSSLVMNAFCYGKERALTFIGLADGICTLALSLILVSRMGMIGIPIAALASALLIGVPTTLRLIARTLGSSPLSLIRPILPMGLANVCSLGILSVVRWYWVPQQLWELVVATGLAVGLYLGLTWLPLRNSAILSYLQPILHRWREPRPKRKAA